ncbi:hypothetical protein [Citricoccus alkalitolerans]|uniref:Integral membrane protein n=1 Tax=Citricoccus alkalitolerans TaxID=246603 RepID=A0ABV8XSX9_9MICC
MTIAPDSTATAQAGGPGSGLRLSSWDVGFLASVLAVLAGSIVPLATSRWGLNLWGSTNLFFLGIGVLMPLVAAGFILARAASAGTSTGDAGPRLGSLSTEQFAHVTAWLALSYFFITFVTTLDPVLLIGLAGAFGLVATSPMRSLIAPLFAGSSGAARPTASSGPAREAHEEHRSSPEPTASPESSSGGPSRSVAEIEDELGMTRVRPRPTAEAEASATAAFGAPAVDSGTADPSPGPGGADEATATSAPSGPSEPFQPSPSSPGPEVRHTAPIDPLESGPAAPRGTEPAEYEAFWFAVGTRRTAMNPEDGSPAFGLEPGGWILALEDRGHEFLVQNTDGRTGVLEDLTDIERA